VLLAPATASPQPWHTITVRRQHGALTAVLTYGRRRLSFGAFTFRNLRLRVTDAGQMVLDRGLCGNERCAIGSVHTLSLASASGGPVPDVFLDVYTAEPTAASRA
jgi:hypothetical protein